MYLGIGGLAALEEERPGYLRDYWKEIVTVTGAQAIRPIHHDDFTEPFGSHAGFPAFAADIETGLEAVSALAGSAGVRLDMLPLLEPVGMIGRR
ncbi:MAG: hypothetical protein HKP30_17520 [Myxococcales bacterium]|nr:hypothetical protein [Myxococcales bacterium]